MRYQERGAVLIVSLMLLAVATVVGIAGIGNTQLAERIASNQKQASEAFMAAESGLVRAKVWFDDPANAGLWGDSVGTLAAINAGQQNLQNQCTVAAGIYRLCVSSWFCASCQCGHYQSYRSHPQGTGVVSTGEGVG